MTDTRDARRYVLRHFGSNQDVLGPLCRENAYLTAYPQIEPGWPTIDALQPDERTRAVYRLSGTQGTYDIWRLPDAADDKTFHVLVPKPDTRPGRHILPGSGIVTASVDDALSTVYFEGNLYDSESMRDFAARVLHAAGRLDNHYPTVALGRWPTADFDVVGTFTFAPDWRTHQLTITDQARVDQWTGSI